MTQISAEQVVTDLDKILDPVAQGQEVIIVRSDGSVFKLVALPRTAQACLWSARGFVHIGRDFDEPIEGFENYVP